MSTLALLIDVRQSLVANADDLTSRDDYDMPADMLTYFLPHLSEKEREDGFAELLRAVVAVDAGFSGQDRIEDALDELVGSAGGDAR